jgi:hypothetical protein
MIRRLQNHPLTNLRTSFLALDNDVGTYPKRDPCPNASWPHHSVRLRSWNSTVISNFRRHENFQFPLEKINKANAIPC